MSPSTSTHDLLSTHLLNFPLFFFLPLPASSHHSFNSGLPTSAFLFSSFFVFSLSFLLQTPSFPLSKYSHLPSYFIIFQLPLSIPHFLTLLKSFSPLLHPTTTALAPADSSGLYSLYQSLQGYQLMLMLKQHLKDMYGFTDRWVVVELISGW